eukprot:TRINITY_DN17735_c0_g1_i1.p1 TRINITY_DN17735_c0_g1~~TRINITY_DN17735_c0_g1_i1.p1  ORF type:complete len:177 (+),score=22.53 TRINITY_DN17735_c0_g1_i1:2-532(+)
MLKQIKNIQANSSDYKRMNSTIFKLQKVLTQFEYKNYKSENQILMPYGSWVSGNPTKMADLDVCLIDNKSSRIFENKTNSKTFKNHLSKNFGQSFTIKTKRLFLVKLVSRENGVEIDMSINNTLPILKSLLLRNLFEKDNYFLYASLWIKMWAQSNGLNDSNLNTFNSVCFFFFFF